MCDDKLDASKVDTMSIDDIQLANMALDAWFDADRRHQERITREAKEKNEGLGHR